MWSDCGDCTVTCGVGTRARARVIKTAPVASSDIPSTAAGPAPAPRRAADASSLVDRKPPDWSGWSAVWPQALRPQGQEAALKRRPLPTAPPVPRPLRVGI
jgi:hypothetical protein